MLDRYVARTWIDADSLYRPRRTWEWRGAPWMPRPDLRGLRHATWNVERAAWWLPDVPSDRASAVAACEVA